MLDKERNKFVSYILLEKTRWRKKMNILLRFFSWICFAVILFCCVLSLVCHGNVNFQTYAEGDTTYSFNNVCQILAFLLFLTLLIFILMMLRSVGRRITVGVTIFCALTIIILGCIWIDMNTYPPIADQKKVWSAIVGFTDHNYSMIDRDYFEQYPFQGGIVTLFSVLLRLFSTRSILAFRITNVVAAGAIVVTMVWLSWELFGEYAVSLLTAAMTTAFVPIIFYTSFVYGTLLSLEFSLLAFVMLTQYLKKRRLWKMVLLTFFIAVSNTLYSGSVIASIAIGFVLVLNGLTALRSRNKKVFLTDLLSVLFLMICAACFSGFCRYCFFSATGISEQEGIPSSAFILMGITSDGTCGPGSYDTTNVYIYEISGRSNKAANQEAWSRINYAVRDYIRGRRDCAFFVKKLRNEWTDPWFSSAVMTIYLWADNLAISDAFSAFLSGTTMIWIQGFLNIFVKEIYFFATISMVGMMLKLKKSEKVEVAHLLLPIYFLGGFIFYLFWEAKPRYCFPFIVCLIPLAAYAAVRIATGVRIRKI